MALRLLCVLAHPDDESLALGGTLARYGAEGVETHLLTATRGEHGWIGDEASYPGIEALGAIREGELTDAARVLGLTSVQQLDYEDGRLDEAPASDVIGRIAAQIQTIRPQVVLTFGPDGVYGHPDHIAISQLATAACVGGEHLVSKLYYLAETERVLNVYESVFGELGMDIDGVRRRSVRWPDWIFSAEIDTHGFAAQAWQAVNCHRSQMPAYGRLAAVSDADREVLWGSRTYYRAFSRVNGGRKREIDLFEGLR